jgi:hypothetical protein
MLAQMIANPKYGDQNFQGQSKRRNSNGKQDKARRGREDKERQVKAREGQARQGKARQEKERQGKAREDEKRQGKAREATQISNDNFNSDFSKTPSTSAVTTCLSH